ncbi:MAG: hypothetical protein ACW96N_09205, partial [Candidatus Thorarchaeota archaeon]
MEKPIVRSAMFACLVSLLLVNCTPTEEAKTFDLDRTLDIPVFGISIDYPWRWSTQLSGNSGAEIYEIVGPSKEDGYQVLLGIEPVELFIQPFSYR